MPTPTLIERVAEYHKLACAAVADLCEKFPGADVTDLRQPSPFQPEGKDGQSGKQLLRLPCDARKSATDWVSQLSVLSQQIMAEFEVEELRSVRPPTLHVDVLHSSINFNDATSVEKINLHELVALLSEWRRALPSLPAADQARVATELKTIGALDPTTLRFIRSSGSAYILRSITRDDQSLRSNVNHLVILVSASDELPSVFWGRPRRRRGDTKIRVPVLDWPGGHYVNDGKRRALPPRRIYQI